MNPLATLPSAACVYRTALGMQLATDSREALAHLPAGSVDLVVTSPPFALVRKKTYGNEDQAAYVAWLHDFGRAVHRVLKESGSFVLDLGGAYQRGQPVRSLYNYRVLLDLCDGVGFHLAEEFFWHNPARLPSPIEWVNKRKIRVKDAVDTVWWLSRSEWPKADVRRVLVPYSGRMRRLIADPERYYRPKERPSGHDIGRGFAVDNGGAIPSNLLRIPNTASGSRYLQLCQALGRPSHPARFPAELPGFFIRFLTEPGDLVVDIFSGSNTSGWVAEGLGRRWLAIDERRDYAALSAVRFLEGAALEEIAGLVERMEAGEAVDLSPWQPIGRATP